MRYWCLNTSDWYEYPYSTVLYYTTEAPLVGEDEDKKTSVFCNAFLESRKIQYSSIVLFSPAHFVEERDEKRPSKLRRPRKKRQVSALGVDSRFLPPFYEAPPPPLLKESEQQQWPAQGTIRKLSTPPVLLTTDFWCWSSILFFFGELSRLLSKWLLSMHSMLYAHSSRQK